VSDNAIRIAVTLAVVVACATGSCGGPDPEGAGSPSAGRELQGAVLILLDTVRADHLSSYGHTNRTSPVLDRLASQGVLFEQVVSFAPWTLPSLATILSAKPPGAVYRDGRLRESIVERIAAAGYRTSAITEGGYFSRQLGFDLGFEHYVEEEGHVQLLPPGQPRNPNPTGGIHRTFRAARDWIAAHRDEPFFLVIHTYEPHTPYNRHAFTEGLDRGSIGDVFRIDMLSALRTARVRLDDAELEYLAALYDGGIHESDRYVGEFLSYLESAGLRDRTLVVVTSDHGEELGEHYRTHVADHGHALFDDQLLVPLILYNPVESYPVKRVTAQVRTMDILPTIADLLGVAPGEELDGRTLVPLMRGEERSGRMAVGGETKAGPRRAFLRHLGYKFITVTSPSQGKRPLPTRPPQHQLYDLRSDPGERVNLAEQRPDLTREFRETLRAVTAGRAGPALAPDPERLDAELLERLRSLGYVP
jgi:arylsulfatase A-like enzyme